MPLTEALPAIQRRSREVIALGTMSFAAEMAAYLGLDTETWIDPWAQAQK